MKASDLFVRVNTIIQDPKLRWPDDELLLWLNDGQKAVVDVRPAAYTRPVNLSLQPGTTRQVLPDDAQQLVAVRCNVDTSNQRGKAVRMVDRTALESREPYWNETAPAAEVAHVMYDPDRPGYYDVWPAPKFSSYIDADVSATPPDVPDENSPIVLDARYHNALLYFILFRAYSKDAENAHNAQLAAGWYTMFERVLGVRKVADKEKLPV